MAAGDDALPSLFRAFQPVHPDEIPPRLGCYVVVTGGGGVFSGRPVYQGVLERIAGTDVFISGQRVRADQIIDIRRV